MTKNEILLAIDNEMERQGLDTKALADRAGIAESTMRNWMNGTAPSLDKLIRVAEALGMVVLCCYRVPPIKREAEKE